MNPFSLLLSFFPPDLSPSYLLALVPPMLATIGLAFGAMFLAICISLPLGLLAAIEAPGSRSLLSGLAALRAIPDLTLAILCVVLFGIGPGAGLVALTIYYSAGVAKMFADILRTAPHGPLLALRAAGASRLQVALYGLLPLKRQDLISYGAYEFECALRSAVVVGAVGGGGIGSELLGSLVSFDFRRVAAQVIVLAIVIAGFEAAASQLKRRPAWLIALAPIGVIAVVAYGPRFFALSHAATVFARMWPPEIPADGWAKLPQQIAETIWIAAAGTGGALAFALIAGPASARNLAPVWLAWPVRRLNELLRTIPEVVWALVLIAVVGIGPVAGAWAIGIHTAGTLSRLFAETLENAPRAPQEAVASTGASRLGVLAYATAPLAIGPLAAHTLFRFEWNLRIAAVLGAIGAGGVGQALYEAQQLFFYRQMLGYILVTAMLVGLVDAASERLRRRYGLLEAPM